MKNVNHKIFDAHLHTHGTFLAPNESLIEYLNRFRVKKAIITTINRAASSKIYTKENNKESRDENKIDKVKQAFENLRKMTPRGQLDHQDVIEIANKEPDRFYKFFWFNPKIKTEEIEDNYKILENHFNKGFCGVKIHSGIHLIKIPKDIEYLASFMQEKNKGFPIFIHTTPKMSFFGGISGKDIAKLAESFPELKIIVGHAALAMEYAIEFGLTLKNYSNVYFETSCSIPYGILSLIKMLGHKRIIFGSDAPVTNPMQIEIDKILCLPIADELKQDILYNNVINLLTL